MVPTSSAISDAEAAGLNFFVDALNKGTLNIKNIAIAILDGAQGTDKTISSNKVAAADLYTKALDTATEIGSYQGNTAAAQGRTFITGVTTAVPTAAAVDTAVATMVSAGAAGATVSLTGGIGTPAVLATDKNDTINSTGANWSTANDKIDAGLGQDTFNLTAAVTATVAADGLKNVEIFNITANGGAAATIDVAEGKQLTQVWNVAGATKENLSVTNVALTTTVGVKGDLGAGTTSFGFAAATGTADTATLALSDAKSTGAITISDIETLNISNTGTSSVTVTAAAAKAIAISGSGDLTFGSASTAIETVTATGANVTANLSAQTALKSFTGGNGSEKITIDPSHTNDITINLGAGSDQITVLNGAGTQDKAITLTGGAGADIFVFGTGAVATASGNVNDVTNAASIAKSLITISDFTKAEDAVKVAGAKDALLVAEQNQVSAASDIKAAADLVASFTNGKTTVFTFGGDAYIFADSNAGGTFNQGDTLIKIVGASAADFNDTNLQYLA